MMAGILQILGKISEYIQGREERRRNQLDALRKEYDKLRKEPQTVRNTHRMLVILKRIGVLEALDKNK